MSQSPRQVLEAALSTPPREAEYLDVDTSGWSDTDKADGAKVALDAGLKGDGRAARLLIGLLYDEALTQAWRTLAEKAPPESAMAAIEELADKHADRAALRPLIERVVKSGRLTDGALRRAARLLHEIGGDAAVRALVGQGVKPADRSVVATELWSLAGLSKIPTNWWEGLGLVRLGLQIPMASFFEAALTKLDALLANGVDAVEGSGELADLPEDLRAFMLDIKRGRGELDDDLLAAVQERYRKGATLFAAGQAVNHNKERGIRYVSRLAGADHRDLYAWALTHPLPAMNNAGAAALARLH